MIITKFERTFTKGNLIGCIHIDKISHPDIKHANKWVKDVKKSSKEGCLDYKLTKFEHFTSDSLTEQIEIHLSALESARASYHNIQANWNTLRSPNHSATQLNNEITKLEDRLTWLNA